jgi:dUTP pyrophosphatase
MMKERFIMINMELTKTRGFEVVKGDKRKTNGVIILPTRGTKDSAGYDFYSTETFTIKPQETKLIWSDVKAYMQIGEVLEIYVRSSIGINKHLMLSNLTGIIDADYYSNPKNDGNIGICLFNYGDEIVTIEKDERIAQGIFKQFLVSDNGNTDEERTGGTGSTGK